MMIDRMIAWAALTLLLAACAQGSVGSFSGEYVSAFYSPSLVSYEAGDGRFPMVVRGNPFGGVPNSEVERSVRQNARLPGWTPSANFVREDRAEAAQGLRLVVVLNPARDLSFREMCGDLSQIPLQGPANQLTIRVAFCDHAQTMTDATLRAAPSPDERSASFTGSVVSAVYRALPFVDRASTP